MSEDLNLNTDSWQEYKKEVDGVEKVFVKLEGKELEVAPLAQVDQNGELLTDENGNIIFKQNFNNEDNMFVEGEGQNVDHDPTAPMDE